jgi:CheY-like chemotaxis protein
VECHSQLGKGTRFDLYLPRASPAGAVATPTPALAASPAGQRRVLLAEDNDTLRSLAMAFLRQAGFQVVPAEDGRHAVDIYQHEHARIDLVILAQSLPVLAGPAALEQLRQINPEVRVLLAHDPTAEELTAGKVQGVVHKPYRQRDLLQAVQTALAVPPM